MSNKFEEIDIKNCMYYFFYDMSNMKSLKNNTKIFYLPHWITDYQRS